MIMWFGQRIVVAGFPALSVDVSLSLHVVLTLLEPEKTIFIYM